MKLRRIPVLGVVLLAVLAACDSHDPDIDLEEPIKLEIRDVNPADSVRVYDHDNLSITFNRTVSLDEFTAQIFPRPTVTGSLELTGSGRNATWFDIDWNPNWGIHKLILAGEPLQTPMILHYFTGEHVPFARLDFMLTVPPSMPRRSGATLIFALAPGNTWDWFHPTNLADQVPISVAFYDLPDTTETIRLSIGDLVKLEQYILVTVNDTNGDGWFDPGDDYWGYPFDEGVSTDPLYATAFTSPDSIAMSFQTMELQPPKR